MEKVAIVLFSLLVSINLNAKTYYIDASNGNDKNDGVSVATSWKTIAKVNQSSFSAGDHILLKRNEIWREQMVFKSPGTIEQPIVIGAYGKGNRPIVTVNYKMTKQWTHEGGNIWKIASFDYQPWRLRLDGVEKLMAVSKEELDGSHFFWYIEATEYEEYNVVKGDIYLYSVMDPNTLLVETNQLREAFRLSAVEYVIVRDIDVQGGFDGCFSIADGCANVKLINNQIGAYARFGVTLQNSQDILIDSCTIDALFEFQYKTSSQRGPQDGVTTWGAVKNLELKNSLVRTWGHDAVYFHAYSKEGYSKNHRVHNCIIEGINSYCRAFETGGYADNNVFYNNIARHMTARSQVGGTNNIFHHNLFYDYKNSPVKSNPVGQVFMYQNFDEPLDSGNIIEFNTFIDIDEQALFYIKNSDDGSVRNNIFRNNIIYNAGRNSIHPEDKGIGIKLIDKKEIIEETIINNCIYSPLTDKVIHYRGTVMTVDEFNEQNGIYGDIIGNNNSAEIQFVDPDKKKYNLHADSPCVGMGR